MHQKKESPKGVVNNQILDWSFRLDGIFHNASQDHVFDTVASDIVTSALDGYNGNIKEHTKKNENKLKRNLF